MAESNSVFISYRRDASAYLALAVYQDLRAFSIDSFYDIESIDSGTFDTIILNQIAAHPYFLPILTPGTLDRCANAGDWVLREMEHAMNLNRVFVPVFTPEFNRADIDRYLPAALADYLKRHNMMEVPPRFFKYAMQDVRERFLKPTTLGTTPTPRTDAAAVARKLDALTAQPQVTEKQLTASEYFERALAAQNSGNLASAITDYTEAIRLNPKYAIAYSNRGVARKANGDLNGAIADYTKGIRLDPNPLFPYLSRGIARHENGDFLGAIADFTQAIQLDPLDAMLFFSRGVARWSDGDLPNAITDYTEAIRLDPTDADFHHSRGIARFEKGDQAGALADYTEAIRLSPKVAETYKDRGFARGMNGDMSGAITDYTEAIRLDPTDADFYYFRGDARAVNGNTESAIANYRKVLELSPSHPQAAAIRDYIKKWGG